MARGGLTRICALAGAAAALLGAPAAAQARDATVRSFDGTPIVTHFFPAPGLKPGQRAPTVLVGHGYGFMGATSDDTESDSIFGQVGTGPLHRAGYNILTWDARGFGGSGGQVEIDSKDFEGRDVQALISHVARQPEVQLDGPGDPRMGMAGPSYGGGIQLVTAGLDRRVDAITPVIAWNSLLTALYKNGVVKSGWGAVLSGAGGSAAVLGLFSPAGPQLGFQDPRVTSAVAEGLATGRFSKPTQQFFAKRGLPALVQRVRVPTLLVEGTADTLFTLKESIENQRILASHGVPVKVLWFCGGHGICLAKQGEVQPYVEDAVVRWLDRYVKRNHNVNTGPAFRWVAQDGVRRSGVAFPPVVRGMLQAGAGSGTLALAPTANATSPSALIAQLPASAAVNVDIPAPRSDAELVGEPRLRFSYRGTGAPADTHVFGQIEDVSTGLLLGNQATPIPVTLDGRTHQVDIPLEAIAAHATPSSRFRLQITASSTLYSPQRSSGLLQLSGLSLRTPIIDPKAFAPARLKVGRTGGFRRARRGRPFRVQLRARGVRMERVRVVARDRRGRLVGRSRVFALGPKRRTVHIRVNRRIRPGRYRLRAAARAADGRLLRASRSYRIRGRRR